MIQRFRHGIDQPVWGAKLWGAKISSNLPNLDSLCLNWPFGVEIGLYLRQIASKIGQLNSLTNCLVFLVSLGQISLVNFYLVSKTRNFCSLFLVSHPRLDQEPLLCNPIYSVLLFSFQVSAGWLPRW